MNLNSPFNSSFKTVRKAGAGLLMFVGVPILFVSGFNLFDGNPGVRELSLILFSFVGLPPTALGGWLIWGLRQQANQEQLEAERLHRHRLNATFFRAIADGNGAITPLQFSMATQISGDEARAFLDSRAKEFDATYDVTAEGTLVYRFEVQPKQLAARLDDLRLDDVTR